MTSNENVQALPAVAAPRKKRGSLTQFVIGELVDRIERHIYRPGERMPSEHQLCQEFEVSRTVVREAVASMRLAGHLISRQGVGVFVAQESAGAIELPAISAASGRRIALNILELRLALEVEAARLAAERRTAKDLAEIVEAFEHTNRDYADVSSAVEADFTFHLAIARASNNPHFANLLESAVRDVLLDLALKRSRHTEEERAAYEKNTAHEHEAIVMAIMRGQPRAARDAMHHHLSQNIKSYRSEVLP